MSVRGESAVKSSVWRAGVLLLGLSFGLGACLSSDAPKLATEDLTEPAGFAGVYYATDFPEEKSTTAAIDGNMEAVGGRTFRLTFAEGDHKDEPILVRLLRLNDGSLLGIGTDPDPTKSAVYAMVTHASDGSWVFRSVDFRSDSRGGSLRDALKRHGATGVTFGDGNVELNEIKGSLTAANLRALFSDPDFTRALETSRGFRLSPKQPVPSSFAPQ
jgi:hypothetical protein